MQETAGMSIISLSAPAQYQCFTLDPYFFLSKIKQEPAILMAGHRLRKVDINILRPQLYANFSEITAATRFNDILSAVINASTLANLCLQNFWSNSDTAQKSEQNKLRTKP